MTPRKVLPPSQISIGAAQLRLLERLCNASAVSGDEGEVRKIVLDEVRAYVDEVRVDALGNVIAEHRGANQGCPRILLAAHMDEIGFMLVDDGDEGLYRFDTVGGIDPRQLPGKAVWVGPDHLPGVIGARPIHHTTAEERRKSIPLDSLRIDLGPGGEGKAKMGDRAVFATPFTRLGESVYAKALDNRLGVATLIELVRRAPANVTVLAVFTVQEEIGGRGARVGAYALNPDAAIAVDSTPAYDLPTWDDSENGVYNTHLGQGPAIYIADSGTLADPRWVRHLISTADARKIPFQIRQPGGGSTDASAMQRQRNGIPVVSVSVPGRYAHTAGSIARIADWKNTLALLSAALETLPPDLFAR
jgi:tetrahedral aminopeptidase